MHPTGLVRAHLLTRGIKPPPFDNGIAHSIIWEIQNRERDAELAKLDYTVHSLAAILGIPADRFERVFDTLTKLRAATSDVLKERVYDERFDRLRGKTKKEKRRSDVDLLDKVSKL